MKTFLTIAFVLAMACIANAQYNEKNLKLDFNGASTYRFLHLQLYPIRANEVFTAHHKKSGNYLSLKEALDKNKIAVTEYQQGRSDGQVNTLVVENTSQDTVMILSGEVIQGGKQDRMIAQDIILYPKSGKQKVSVFCVEQGRWQSRGDAKAFKQYSSIPSNEVRKAATVDKNQREVWNKVAETNAKNKAETTTGTLAALEKSESFNKTLRQYTDHFQKVLIQEKDIIGVVAVSGDKIIGCDMFATHALFEKHYANLIKAYATQAITSGKDISVSYQKVKEYVSNILADENRQEKEIEKNGTLLKAGDKKIHISTF